MKYGLPLSLNYPFQFLPHQVRYLDVFNNMSNWCFRGFFGFFGFRILYPPAIAYYVTRALSSSQFLRRESLDIEKAAVL